MIEEMHSICTKYKYLGLDICVEFNTIGVVLRGYWENRSGELMTYNRIYDYTYFSMMEASLSEIAEMFKNEILEVM
mgnify:CR=1 FL=1